MSLGTSTSNSGGAGWPASGLTFIPRAPRRWEARCEGIADRPSCWLVVVRQPPAGESGGAQPGDDIRTPSHQSPHQPRLVVLDHHHDRSLVDAEVPRRNPAERGTSAIGEGRIERRLVAVPMDLVEMQPVE